MEAELIHYLTKVGQAIEKLHLLANDEMFEKCNKHSIIYDPPNFDTACESLEEFRFHLSYIQSKLFEIEQFLDALNDYPDLEYN